MAPSEPRFIPDSSFTCSRLTPLGFRVVKVGAVSHILVATEFCPGKCKGKSRHYAFERRIAAATV